MDVTPVEQLLASLPIDKSTAALIVARTQQRFEERAAGICPDPHHPTHTLSEELYSHATPNYYYA